MTTGPTLDARVAALGDLVLPRRRNPRREGYGVALIEQPHGAPATSLLRRRVRELARGAKLIEFPKCWQARFDRSGSTVASIDFSARNDDDGPIIIWGIGKVDAGVISAGSYTAVVKVGGREITEGEVDPTVAFDDDKSSKLNDNGDLPAPIVLRRGEHLTVDIVVDGGTVVANAAWELRGCVLRDPNRSKPGLAADDVAEQLINEGELFVLSQIIDANTPQGERTYPVTRPTTLHCLFVDGLSTWTSFTNFNAIVGGEEVFGPAGVNAFAAGADDSLFVGGEWAVNKKETVVIGAAAAVVGAGSVTALWLGRRFPPEA